MGNVPNRTLFIADNLSGQARHAEVDRQRPFAYKHHITTTQTSRKLKAREVLR